ncbi:hypothetical protein [Micromonospora globbae]|nr:hypothetical protein [Micromonospora globbae]
MFARLRRPSRPTVSFSDRCGEVCTSQCRADARRERARTSVLAATSFIR